MKPTQQERFENLLFPLVETIVRDRNFYYVWGLSKKTKLGLIITAKIIVEYDMKDLGPNKFLTLKNNLADQITINYLKSLNVKYKIKANAKLFGIPFWKQYKFYSSV